MKLCTFENLKGELKIGAKLSGEKVVELHGFDDMKDLITRYYSEKDQLKKNIEQAAMSHNIDDVKLRAPIMNPGKMIFIGLNYREHAKEANLPIPEKPIIFAKYNNSIVGHEADVVITGEITQCDYEAELAFIVGKKAKSIPQDKAMEYIFGYTACNDISARNIQFGEGGQWLRGKAIDTFAPVGPVLVTADELLEPHNLSISCRVNGITRQDSNTNEFIFNLPYLLSFLSRTMTLEPGDLVSTGTPSGVAAGMESPLWLKPGDICEVEIEGIGVLRNKMVADC